MSFFDCCCHHDGLNTGGCLYCVVRTYCAACGKLVACSCGNKIGEHVCPNVVATSVIVPVPMFPLE